MFSCPARRHATCFSQSDGQCGQTRGVRIAFLLTTLGIVYQLLQGHTLGAQIMKIVRSFCEIKLHCLHISNNILQFIWSIPS